MTEKKDREREIELPLLFHFTIQSDVVFIVDILCFSLAPRNQ